MPQIYKNSCYLIIENINWFLTVKLTIRKIETSYSDKNPKD